MSELSREQIVKLEEWGMQRLLVVPTINLQELLDFCTKVCREKWGDEFLELSIIWDEIEKVYDVMAVFAAPDNASFCVYKEAASLSLALYNLIEKIKEQS